MVQQITRNFQFAKRFHFNEKSEKYDHLLDILLKRPMALSAQLRNHAFLIKKNLSEAMNIKADWLKVVIISPWKTTWPFIRTNLNPLHPSMLYARLCEWNWLWWKRFFFQFRCYIPMESGVALHLNKLESLTFKVNLCQVRSKLSQWFWWRCLFLRLYFLGNGVVLHLN